MSKKIHELPGSTTTGEETNFSDLTANAGALFFIGNPTTGKLYKITRDEFLSLTTGNLQQVTDEGNSTTNNILIPNAGTTGNYTGIGVLNDTATGNLEIDSQNFIGFYYYAGQREVIGKAWLSDFQWANFKTQAFETNNESNATLEAASSSNTGAWARVHSSIDGSEFSYTIASDLDTDAKTIKVKSPVPTISGQEVNAPISVNGNFADTGGNIDVNFQQVTDIGNITTNPVKSNTSFDIVESSSGNTIASLGANSSGGGIYDGNLSLKNSSNNFGTILHTPSSPTVLRNIYLPQPATDSKILVASVNGKPADTTGNIELYKVYTALLSQSSTGAPTAIILENTTGDTLTWTRTTAGNYQCSNSSGSLFTVNKTYVMLSSAFIGFGLILANNVTSNFNLQTYHPSTFSNVDNLLDKTTIEIRVYP